MARMLFFVVATSSLLITPQLLSVRACVTLLLLGIGLQAQTRVIRRRRAVNHQQFSSQYWLIAAAYFCFGLSYSHLIAQQALDNRLDTRYDRMDFRVSGTVTGLVDRSNNASQTRGDLKQRSRFVFAVEEIEPVGITRSMPHPRLNRIKLSSYGEQVFNTGEQWQLTVRLRSPRGFNNPGNFDYPKYLFAQSIDATGYVLNATPLYASASNKTSVATLRAALHKRVVAATEGRTHQGTILALIFGDKSKLKAAQRDLFINTGTAHLMAISGLHIGIAAGVGALIVGVLIRMFPPLLLCMPNTHWRGIGCLLSAFLYAVLAGFSISTQRALLMLCIVISCRWLGVKLTSSQLIALIMFVLLLINPISVLDNGFWLSVFSVATLLFIVSQHRYRKHECVDQSEQTIAWIQKLKIVSQNVVAAQTGLFVAMPLILALMSMPFSFLSPLANLFSVSYFSLAIVPLCLLGIPFSIIDVSAAVFLYGLIDQLLQFNTLFIENLTNAFDSDLTKNIRLDKIEIVFLFFAVILLLSRRSMIGFGLALLIWSLFIFEGTKKSHSEKLKLRYGEYAVTQLDVGQGTAILISTQYQHWLYDTGFGSGGEFDAGRAIVVPYLNAIGVTKLDGLIVSHGDSDHSGGLNSILNQIDVEQLILSGSALDEVDVAAYRKCQAGDEWKVDGVIFQVLHPDNKFYTSENDYSCVIKVIGMSPMSESANASLLLTGDISHRVERQLVSEWGNQLASALVSVPHHGSVSSSSLQFLAAVDPKVGLISAGFNNRYHHPSPKIQTRYSAYNIQQLRSDQLGALQMIYQAGEWRGPYCHRYARRHFWNDASDIAKSTCLKALDH